MWKIPPHQLLEPNHHHFHWARSLYWIYNNKLLVVQWWLKWKKIDELFVVIMIDRLDAYGNWAEKNVELKYRRAPIMRRAAHKTIPLLHCTRIKYSPDKASGRALGACNRHYVQSIHTPDPYHITYRTIAHRYASTYVIQSHLTKAA